VRTYGHEFFPEEGCEAAIILARRWRIFYSSYELLFNRSWAFCSLDMATNKTAHVPVMLTEILEWANLTPSSKIVDGTLGGGGHARRFIQGVGPNGLFIGMDRDPNAVELTQTALREEFDIAHDTDRCKFIAASYVTLPKQLVELNISNIDVVLVDLGLSSDQLASEDRGFSFKTEGELDLRYNPEEGISARELLAKIKEVELANIIYQFGEERFSRRIARAIVEQRRVKPIETSDQLHSLIHRVVPGRVHGRVDASTRTFQALRIAVNRELEHLEQALQTIPACLAPGGRFLAISFHSLEDRLVKNAFRDHPLLNRLTKKPLLPSQNECDSNPRSRSAKLRVAERIDSE
jgi:16S rRNA (cytosine1402-N4)-methyltransferase